MNELRDRESKNNERLRENVELVNEKLNVELDVKENIETVIEACTTSTIELKTEEKQEEQESEEEEEEEEIEEEFILPFTGAEGEEQLKEESVEADLTKLSKRKLRKLQREERIKKHKDDKKMNKLMPNYFFCVRIFNQKIIDTIHNAQKTIIQNHAHLKSAMVKIDSLHVTLCAINLSNENQISVINDALKEFKEKSAPNQLFKFPLKFQGLSTFRNQVVFVDLLKDENFKYLSSLQKNIVNILHKSQINLTDKHFTPHLTLMKLSKMKNLKKLGIKKIDTNIYDHMKDHDFGEEFVSEVYLCSIHKKQKDGFYNVEASLELHSKIQS